MKLIVGSTALKMYGYNNREPKDTDIFTDEDVALKGVNDVHKVPTEILKLFPQGCGYATPDAIYTLKCSHAPWDIHWHKTMGDILYLRHRGCRLIRPLYWSLYYYWQTIHGDKDFLSLKKEKEDFFNDYVPYKYDHDWLHTVVAQPNRPMYENVLKDNEEVLIDKAKFMQLPHEDQIKLFKEEICVIALERYLIPKNFKIGKYEAYLRALKKTITNLTKNWATLFIVDNYEEFYKMGNADWYSNFIKFNVKEGAKND